jgi:hypothetical protein
VRNIREHDDLPRRGAELHVRIILTATHVSANWWPPSGFQFALLEISASLCLPFYRFSLSFIRRGRALGVSAGLEVLAHGGYCEMENVRAHHGSKRRQQNSAPHNYPKCEAGVRLPCAVVCRLFKLILPLNFFLFPRLGISKAVPPFRDWMLSGSCQCSLLAGHFYMHRGYQQFL